MCKLYFYGGRKKIKNKQAWASCAKLRLRSSLKLDQLDVVKDNIKTRLGQLVSFVKFKICTGITSKKILVDKLGLKKLMFTHS